MKWKWVLGIASASVVVPAIAFYLILSSYNYNNFKPQIVRAVKEATGRELTLGGDISLKIGLTPALVVKNVSFRNAPWGSQAEMAKINRFEISVRLFPLLSRQIAVKRLKLVEPEILFETSSSGKSNLEFETAKQELPSGEKEEAGSKANLPALSFDQLQIEKGRITYTDHELKKTYGLTVDTLIATSAGGSESPIKLKAKSASNGRTFEVTGTLCPLMAFINPGKAWPVDLSIRTESATLSLNGTVKDPLAHRGIELGFTLKGKDLAALMQYLGKSPGLTGPFDISGRIADTGRNVYSVSSLKVIQGESDLSGSVELNLAGSRPRVTGALSAHKVDLRPYFQAGPGTQRVTKVSINGSGRGDRIFPANPLALDGLRQADADVKIQAAQVLLPDFQLDNLDAALILKDGTLTAKPFKAGLGKGSMDGRFSLQSQGRSVSVAMALKINKLDIGNLAKEVGSAENLEGSVDVDIDLKTQGDSIAGWMAGLNGKTVLEMGKGKIGNKYIDLLGGDFSSSLFRLINPFQKETEFTSVNCFVSGFDIKDGVAKTTVLALNTDAMVVVGKGEINLKTERLDLSLKPAPKEGIGSRITGKLTVSLSELTRPFKMAGTLAHPSLAIDPTQTAITLGKAIGGGMLLGPVGIASALVGGSSPGDNSCVAVVEAAQKGTAAPKGPVAAVEEGIGGVFKGAGNQLQKLFGK